MEHWSHAHETVSTGAPMSRLCSPLEAAQLDIGEEEDEQEHLTKLLYVTHGPGSFGGV